METGGHRYRMEIEVDAGVIDELGHVSNVTYLEWALAVAKEHSLAVGYNPAASAALGAAFVVRRHELDYHRPVFEGQRVELTTWVDSWSSAASVRRTDIHLIDNDNDTVDTERLLVAALKTQWVFAALPSGRPRRIPPELRQAYDSYKG